MTKLALPPPLRHPTPRVLRQFGAGLVCLLLVLAYTLRASAGLTGLALGLAALAGALAAAVPSVLRWPFVAVSLVTYPLGLVLQRVLLAAGFFLVFTPFALGLRAVRRARGEVPVTGWRPAPPARPPEEYFRPY